MSTRSISLLQVFRGSILRILRYSQYYYCSYSQYSQYSGLQYCSYFQYSQYEVHSILAVYFKYEVCWERLCNIRVVFTDCESCTRPISTNPGSMEAGEYGLRRGTCFVAHVSRWSRSPGCCGFCGAFWMRQDFFVFFFPIFFSFFERTRPAASMRPPCLIYLSTST